MARVRATKPPAPRRRRIAHTHGTCVYVYTAADLRKTLGDEDEEKLDKVLDATRNGYKLTDADLQKILNDDQKKFWDNFLDATRNGVTYNNANLREDLGTEKQKTLDQVLKRTRNGAKFTEADLRKALSDAKDGGKALKNLDDVRKWLGLERKLRFLLYLMPALLLAAIGFLGGRRWRSRLAWAAVPLFIAAAIAYAASGPVYSAIAQPMLDDAFAGSARSRNRRLLRLGLGNCTRGTRACAWRFSASW